MLIKRPYKRIVKNTLLILPFIALSCITIEAQTMAKNDELKLNGDYYLMDKDYAKALSTYLNILKSEPENADIKYKIGICYLNSEQEKSKALPYLEDAAEKISEKYNPNSFKEINAPVDALFLLGSAYRIDNQLDKAMEAYAKYKNYLDPKDGYNLNVVEQYLINCEFAKTMQSNPVNIIATNMGNPINNEAANFNGVISGDGKTIIYTVPGRQGYDIFTSDFKDTAWTTPRNITSILGTGKYMKTSDLSYDGNTLVLALDDPMNSDIYVSHLSRGRWSKVEPLDKEINSKYNETHASLSYDGKTLYFTSDRKGGQGDKDIYKSEMDSKGLWGKPVNLGPVINTPFNEETPFVTENGQILYFSSEGHDGMGGYDIFSVDLTNPASIAINVGYPMNTTDNDLFYKPVGDGHNGYYAFNGKDSYGGRDIYKVFIPEKVEEPEIAEAAEETPEILNIQEELATADSIPEVEAIPVPVEETAAAVAEPEISQQEIIIEAPVAETAIETPVEELQASPVIEPVAEEPVNAVNETFMGNISNKITIESAASYKVQIMALKKLLDLNYFSGLNGVTIAYTPDKWYRYTIGFTTSETEVRKLLDELVSRGYKDAFIRTSKIFPQYTIQVMAVPGPVVDPVRFSNLPEVMVTRGSDSFCRYSTGSYETKEEALASLEKVKSLGYKKAFVAKFGK